ncbi:M16 family metallopeptidase, partial [Candidatus Auribacterota bacterium]
MNYSIKTLKNGLRAIAARRHHTDLCAIALLVRAGGRYDGQLKVPFGTAHFVEHLLFRSCRKRSSDSIYKVIESYGGKIDAGTTREYALVQVTVPSANFEKALEVIRDIVSFPSFNNADLKDEAEIIKGEITREKDRFSVVWNLFFRTLWTKHPFRDSILGSEKEIENITLKDVRKFYGRCYSAKNMVLSVASRFEPEYVQEKASKIFGGLRAGKKINPAAVKEPPQA